ncbi:MAG: hypothetical protein J6D03_01350 [Clostridia bacterium]|nr:hypothetical protein [Clostridia bacterium]
MEDSVITIIAIFLAAILMFIFPMMAVSDRLDDISQLSVQSETSEFVDRIRKKGVLTLDDYNGYIRNSKLRRSYTIKCRNRNTNTR